MSDLPSPQPSPDRPLVSVVLPTYNRAKFLPAAFDAIRSQRMPSYEIIVVDDGSTDETRQLIATLSANTNQPVRYIHQANQGAYGARNTGVDAAKGDYIAFYDSDDVWLPHHLQTCVAALEQYADVDWVYAACELVDFDTSRMIDKTCFHVDGKPRPFMELKQEQRGKLHVITDSSAVLCQIEHGLYCGLQNSVLRRRVFDRLRFEWEMRNEAEDQLFAIKALAAGFRLAYVDDVHVRYHVHGENSSGSAKNIPVEKRVRVYDLMIRGYQRLPKDVALSPVEQRALRKRLNRELFWHVGYAILWTSGERKRALQAFGQGLREWPWDAGQWKTYVVALVRTGLGIGASRHAAAGGSSS